MLGWDLAAVSFGGPEPELTRTGVCQPALFVHGFAVLSALREKGLPGGIDLALGLSLGEVTACAAAGVFDFTTGLRIVAERGRLMQGACESSEGAMAAVIGEPREAVLALCREFDVEAANFNAPGQIIISGERARIAAAVAAAKGRGMGKVIPLNVAGAFHSRLMEPARVAFEAFLGAIPFARPRFPIYSNTTGRGVSEPAAIKAALVAPDRVAGALGGLHARSGGGGERILGARPGRGSRRTRAPHRQGLEGAQLLGVLGHRGLARTKARTDDGRTAHPQLLHHRSRRPRKDDALRPAAAGDPHRVRPDAHGAAPGLDGPGEGARDHDQVASGDHELPGQGRADLQAEPHGHAGARGLLLRGLAQPGRLRGRACS